MSVCKIEGCENEAVQTSGIYGRLCETHALEKKQLRASQQNGAEQGAELADELFALPPMSILRAAEELDEAQRQLNGAHQEYLSSLERLRTMIENLQDEAVR